MQKDDFETEKLSSLRENALNSLEALARSDITLEVEEKSEPVEFRALPKTEQKRIIKNAISKELNSQVKQYLSQAEEYSLETCFNDFKTWLGVN